MELFTAVYLGFFSIMIFSSTLWLIVYFARKEEVYEVPEAEELPTVSLLVPAYNEEEYIEKTLEALLSLDYPDEKLEIIAINDGSTDSTLEKMRQFEDEIEIIDKENTGKAASMNQALENVDSEISGCVDADSYPEEDFLKKMVGYFEDGDVKGVTPALKIRRTENWVESIQWAEYIYQIFLRKMFAIFDAQYVLPGPGSLYRTDFLKELGGWDEDTLTEDMEIAFRMFNEGARIENNTRAFVHTEPPSTLKGLLRQRVRWYRGYIENFVKYSHIIGRVSYGNLGFFFMPFNVVWTGMVIFFSLNFLYNLLNSLAGMVETYLLTGALSIPLSFGLLNLNFFHIFAAYFFLIGVTTMLISLKVSGEDVKLWSRKVHYILFLAVYPMLYSIFWVLAGASHLGVKGKRW